MVWNQAHRAQMDRHGVSEQEIERQLELYRNPPEPLKITRACTPGDGIVQLSKGEQSDLTVAFDEATAKGRFSRFVPASGAASRMFKELFNSDKALSQWHQSGRCPDYPFQQQFFSNLSKFAFFESLRLTLKQQGHNLHQLIAAREMAPVVAALLEASGLDYARRPKGLLDFHAYPDQVRTPFEEHLSEALKLTDLSENPVQLHFTVSPEFLADFEQAAKRAINRIAPNTERQVAFSFSCQQASTDTIAVDLQNRVLLDEQGGLVFRPAGHGALLHNLQEFNGDLVLIKNIDNVVPENQQADVVDWWKFLGGKLVRIQHSIHKILYKLESDDAGESCLQAERLLQDLGLEQPAGYPDLASRKKWLFNRLHRPIRVCGMVRNSGEPGGGPFWVSGRHGQTPQIVEMAQIPEDDCQARAALARATHFNPVLMACALRDHNNHPYPLPDFIDEKTIIISRKSEQGRDLKALERPGLWNGAMAEWLTLFIEVPEQIFQPVKTVNDLLRPGHQVRQA